jgi:hypothetical protein
MIGGEIIMNEKENLRLLWRKRVKDFRVSGLSMKKYSKENNLKIHQLQYWNQKYKGDNKKEASNWVSVDLNNNQTNNNYQSLYLTIGSCKLEIKPGYDQTLFKEVMKVLIEIC